MTTDLPLDRLASWLSEHVPDIQPPIHLRKFSGGQSNPTYLLDAGGAEYVLRRKPFGELLPSAHAIEREYRIISALYPTGFPVPRPYGLCEDPAVVGAAFYVMEFSRGRNFVNGALPDVSSSGRRALYESLVDNLAALHEVDPVAVGLETYGRAGNYFERQIARWTKQYRATQTADLPDMEWLIERLSRTVPAQSGFGIVHGDYRIDNVIFAPNAPDIIGTLDWELSTLGDPLADLSYLAMNWVTPPDGRSGLLGLDLAALDIPTLDEITERYFRRRGTAPVNDLNWYFAFNQFRLAGIMQGIKKRIAEGNASSDDAAVQAARVPATAALARSFLEQT